MREADQIRRRCRHWEPTGIDAATGWFSAKVCWHHPGNGSTAVSTSDRRRRSQRKASLLKLKQLRICNGLQKSKNLGRWNESCRFNSGWLTMAVMNIYPRVIYSTLTSSHRVLNEGPRGRSLTNKPNEQAHQATMPHFSATLAVCRIISNVVISAVVHLIVVASYEK